MTEEEAKEKLCAPDVGHEVIVVSGRKHPKGLRGTVRWMGLGEYGPSVGFLVPGEPKLRYTSPNNLRRIYPGLEPEDSPEGGWVALWEALQNNTRPPKKGDIVRTQKECGEVFWVKGERVGFKSQNGGQAIWADLKELEVQVGASWEPCVLHITAIPAGKNPPSPAGKPEPAEVYHIGTSMGDLPYPFSEIRFVVRRRGEKNFSARGSDDVEICTLPEESVLKFLPMRFD